MVVLNAISIVQPNRVTAFRDKTAVQLLQGIAGVSCAAVVPPIVVFKKPVTLSATAGRTNPDKKLLPEKYPAV